MTCADLVEKMDQAREALTDGDVTPAEYLEWISDMFDGHVAWALDGTPPTPRLKIRMYVVER